MDASENLTIEDVLCKSSDYLARHQVTNFKTDAEWLIAHALGWPRMQLYLKFNEVLSNNSLNSIKKLIMRRGKREPLQHILGSVQFAGLTLKCDSRALVPRHETEFLVDELFKRLGPDFSGKIADLGSGSGAIILSLCSLLPKAHGVGLEKSDAALSLAKENLGLCNLSQQVSFQKHDWQTKSKPQETYDIIVSNPPYLSEEDWDKTQPEVKSYDPKEALIADKQGLGDIETIIEYSYNRLNDQGFLALEFGMHQADTVTNLLKNLYNVEILSDQFLVRRFAIAHKI
jgi:release factor glutamine methyltransferase